MKRILVFFLVTLLVFTSTTFITGAKPENTPKEEVIYGMLDASGQLESLRVVNGFYLSKDSTIADYGTYSKVANLTSQEAISTSGTLLTFQAQSGRTYYQGELEDRQLPWEIEISYLLDGEPIEPNQLDGKSGRLTIEMMTSPNAIEPVTFFDAFSLQVTIPLKMELCRNIKASGATVAEAGSTRQFSYVLLPGENGNIQLSADVTDFEMDAIQIAGIRMAFDFPVDVDQIDAQLNELAKAATKLDSGAVSLIDGAKSLQTGLDDFTQGFQTLTGELDALEAGAYSLASGLTQLADGLQSLSEQGAALREGANAIMASTFQSANLQLAGTGLSELTPENYPSVLGGNPMFEDLEQQLDQITGFVAGIQGYTLGTSQLSEGAAPLETGANELSAGITTLAEGLQQLYTGADSLNQGMKAYLEGVATYRQGTRQFQQGTREMEAEMDKQLDALLTLLSSDKPIYQSFVSQENTNVNFVQFVIKTGEISGETTPPAEAPEPEKKSLWEKFLDLFR